jgi:hypothetical protein
LGDTQQGQWWKKIIKKYKYTKSDFGTKGPLQFQ